MTEQKIRVHVLLNKGKRGISLHKLPRILADIQAFLDSLSQDTVGRGGDWIGIQFRSTSSMEYTAESVAAVEPHRVKDFDGCLKGVIQSKPDPKLSRSTLQRYAKITEPLIEETVSFGIESEVTPEGSAPQSVVEWLDLNKEEAIHLAGQGQSLVKSHGAVQGIVHSVFLGSTPPHFQLRELSTGNLIKCEYDESKYQELVNALETPRAVVHVYGLIFTDLLNRNIQRLQVSRIDIARILTPADLERFIGCAPELMDPENLQDYIDESRGRG